MDRLLWRASLEDLGDVQRTLEVLFASETYHRFEVRRVLSWRKRLDFIAKALAVTLRRADATFVVRYLEELLSSERSKLLPDAVHLIRSHLVLLTIAQLVMISTSIGVFEGQIALRRPSEHPDGEDALRKKIMQYEDYFGLNSLIRWQVIYVNNGDDRYAHDPYRQEKTTTMILKILQKEYPHYLRTGQIKVYEMDHQLRENLGSVHGGCTIYGMRKALEDGAHIVVHNNIDLDCHTALIGNLIAPIVAGDASVVLGSNRVRGGIIRDFNRVRRIFSHCFNMYARTFTTIDTIKDPQNAFKAFSREALEAVLPLSRALQFEKYFDYHFSFPNQLISRAIDLGFAVHEVPSIKHWSAKLATPKPWDALGMIRGLWRQRAFAKVWTES